jgi:acyl carrier protein
MTKDEVKSAVLMALRRVAPEFDPGKLDAGKPIRDQADLDSMDFLHFLLEIHTMLGVDIPENAYREVATLDGCIAYIMAHNPQTHSEPAGPR